MKMHSLVALVCAIGLGVVSISASAQDDGNERSETGTRFSKERYNNKRDARATLSYFGRCVAEYKSDKIGKYLLDPSDTNWKAMTYFPNSQSGCLTQYGMRSSFREMRGALSEGWYLRKYPDGPPAGTVDDPKAAPSQKDSVARIMAADPADRSSVIVDEFALCVAATAPLEADALLRTKVTSKAERAAINALAPYFGPCAFEGQKMSFDVESLRAALDYGMARRVAMRDAT
ncbi:hypothetical protein GRI58_06975 [Porphyrobacter algicida]|uniref:Uncharacterized protein n=1 Tax=Qipengyuania algicida TaxID=1836209 RepID=A0A845ADL2_9SPHN|nr:hypothetical protein [Qipengyuania algicida]MXP28562.1 hypothetical protein [Qipengyuania algicida]